MLAGMIIRPRATSVADQFRAQVLAAGDVLHLPGDHALPGVVDLGADRIVRSVSKPLRAYHFSIIGRSSRNRAASILPEMGFVPGFAAALLVASVVSGAPAPSVPKRSMRRGGRRSGAN